jgi:hypothetical protein
VNGRVHRLRRSEWWALGLLAERGYLLSGCAGLLHRLYNRGLAVHVVEGNTHLARPTQAALVSRAAHPERWGYGEPMNCHPCARRSDDAQR